MAYGKPCFNVVHIVVAMMFMGNTSLIFCKQILPERRSLAKMNSPVIAKKGMCFRLNIME